jgi:protein arginine kinase
MAKWYQDTGNNSDIVLSTRVRLARNIKGIPFPNKISKEQAQSVIDMVDDALNMLSINFKKIETDKISEKELSKLIEARYVSPDMRKIKIPGAVFISEDETISIMVNEEDHIRLQGIFAGEQTTQAYESLEKIDDYLADRLNYAVSEKYGYLTSCLTNVGTGMRVSYMMHLPAVVETGMAEKLFSTIGKLGVTVRGLYGEGTKPTGNIFQISNQITLGRSEGELMENVCNIVNQIIEKEFELRGKLADKKGIIIEDGVMRSVGILKNARLMQSKELMTLLSNVRLGVASGYIKDITSADINTLMVETTPAFLDGGDMERDVARAKIIREKLMKG